jgi:membrane associated rhomboid family serine protease/Flp pilus assembly protein TadD
VDQTDAPVDDPAPADSPPPPLSLPPVVVTPILVGVCTLVSVLSFVTDKSLLQPTTEHLVAWGADFGPLTAVQGQWWRLLTCAFLHGGWIHLALNMWVLWTMGPSCERALGRGGFALVYVTAALGGSLASLAWRPLGVSVGASAAIFGIVGGYLAALHRLRGRVDADILGPLRRSLLSFVAFNLFIGATLPFVDNAAHLGGLVTGGLMSFLLGVPRFRESAGPWSRLGVPAVLGAAVLAVFGVAARQRVLAAPDVVTNLALERGREALAKNQYDEALAEFDRAIKLRDSAPVRMIRGWVFLRLGKLDRGAEDFERAATLDPGSARPLAGLAQARLLQGRASEAWPLYGKALALSPDDVWILEGRAGAFQRAGRLAEALTDLDRSVRLTPQSSSVHNSRAWLLRIMGRLEESLREADQAVTLDPKSPHAIGTRGWTRFQMGDREGALVDCREAVRLRPESLVDVGLIKFAMGDTAGAAAAWE